MFARKFSAYLLVLLLSTAAFAYVSFGTRADQSSGDVFGYYWTDSNAPVPSVAFNWIDATTNGTNAGFYDADNSYVGPVPIGFDFEFYGNNYSMVNISCNGYIEFDVGSSSSYNSQLPYQWDAVNNIVAAYWDDLVVYDTSYNYGAVYYETIGVSPNQQMVIQYHEVSRDYYSNLMTFEIILNETGEIWLQYLSVSGEAGASATIGIENLDGTVATQYSFNDAVVSDGLAIKFERGLMGFGPDSTMKAPWGATAVYGLTITNGQMVTDSFNVTVNHSELGWVVEILDSFYNPLVDNNTTDLAPGETFDLIVRVTVPDPPSAQNETTVLLAASNLDPAVNDTVTLTTRAYQAVFSPPFTDYGYDSDMDGDYDYLIMDVVVDAIVGGYLSVYAYLYDSDPTYITYGTGYAYAPAGISTISVYFLGEDIYENLENGPYSANIWLNDAEGSSIGYTVNDTASYSYLEFDEPMAMFLPPHSDYALDDGDSNDLYDFLIINASLEVFEVGYYTVEADVYDAGTTDYICYVEVSGMLDVGVHEMQLQIPGAVVNESGLAGPCEVYMDLYANNFTWLDDGYHDTGSYMWYDFEGKPVEFLPPYEDYTEDTDLDGYYNYLNITIAIECFETGVYDLDIFVYEWIYLFDTIHETLSLDAGTTTNYTITYYAEKMRNEAVSDSLDLDMYLYDNSTLAEYDVDYYSTSYYYYWDFDPVGANFYDIEDVGRDTDADGYYNELVITIYIDPVSSGNFELEVYVYDYWYDLLDLIEDIVYMEEGVQEVYEVVVDGYDIVANGVDGWFYIYAYVNDETGATNYDTDSYYTTYYYRDDFDPIGAFFESPHDDYGRDDDGDGLYDYLVFELYMNASTSGYYDLEVTIYDYWGYYDTMWLELYLEADTIVLQEIEIDSYSIQANGVNGYWYLYLYLYDHYTSTQYDYDSYTTGDYYYTSDFDSPEVQFDPPHTDYAMDVDADSYYDYLVLEIELDCYQEGDYTVRAHLYDPWDSLLTTLSVTEHLNVGNEEVEIVFDGWIIEYNGVSGYFSVDLEVEDGDGTVLDMDIHYTSYYYYYWFEIPPAEFVAPHGDHGVDDDGDSLFEYLIVNVTVEVYVAGDHTVLGVLWDEWGSPVDGASTEAYLNEGTHEVELEFYGWSIAVGGDDLWYVELELYDGMDNLMDTDTHDLWGAYLLSEFDPTVPSVDSGWAYEVPAIDGVVTADEWFGAVAVPVANGGSINGLAATIYIMNNATHLFVLADVVGDASPSSGDLAMFAFDTDNDGLPTDGHDDQFSLEATGAGADTTHMAYDDWYMDWMEHCFPFDDSDLNHEGLEGAVGFGGGVTTTAAHRVYELCIPLALLALSPGDTVGFAGLPTAFDETEDAYGTWPVYFWSMPELTMYGDLLLSMEPPLTTIELEGEEGENEWFLGDVEVTLSASGGTGGVANTSYNLDGEGWLTYATPFTVTGDGVHTVQFYSTDTADNAEPIRTAEVMIDTEPPITSTSVSGTLGEGGWFVSRATITFSPTDNASDVAFVMYRLDGGEWIELDDDNLRISEDGAHSLEYYAVDIAGNEETANDLEFYVDMTAPITTATLDGSTVTLTVSENISGLARTMYRIDGGEWIVYDGPFKVKGEGNHTVEFFSADVAGNNETVKTIVVEGASGFSVLGLDWWLFLLIAAIVALTVIGVLIGMRRRSRGRFGPQGMPPYPPMMMQQGPQPPMPGSEQGPPVGGEEPMPLPETQE